MSLLLALVEITAPSLGIDEQAVKHRFEMGLQSRPMDAHEPGRQPPDSIDLRELRYFLAVAEELNFTRAAQRLHVAQQALSTSIRKLEQDLGVQLFTRSTRHVALTSAGEALVPGARHAMESTADALDEVRRVAEGQSGRLIIGFAMGADAVPLVRDAIRRFGQAWPDIDLRLVEFDHSDPTAGLASGASQAAFVFAPLPVEGLSQLTLLEELRHVALPVGHPLAQRSQLRAADLAGLPWLRVSAPDSAWMRFWYSHPLGEPSSAPVIRTGVEWVPAVEAGRGVGYILPAMLTNFPNARIATVPVVDLEPGAAVLAWRNEDLDPLVATLIGAVRDMLPGDGAATT